MTTIQQLDLFTPTPTPPGRTWADVRKGERFAFDMPGSEWAGHWTVRRIEDHPSARYLLIVTLTDKGGRTWATWMHRAVGVAGSGFTPDAGGDAA